MEKHSFWASLKVSIVFSDEDFDFIYLAALLHYDYTVRSLTQPGGFLYGAKNNRSFKYENPDAADIEYIKSIELKFRDVDLLIKSLEMEREEKGRNISARLHKIIREMRDKTEQINEQFK